jgi:VIT1/CCC1 family predicted Fe2+/Mn2+ transporter
VANANKLNSTVYFFFGVFLGLTALVFFGDLVAFFAGLAASFFAAAGIFSLSSPKLKIKKNQISKKYTC